MKINPGSLQLERRSGGRGRKGRLTLYHLFFLPSHMPVLTSFSALLQLQCSPSAWCLRRPPWLRSPLSLTIGSQLGLDCQAPPPCKNNRDITCLWHTVGGSSFSMILIRKIANIGNVQEFSFLLSGPGYWGCFLYKAFDVEYINYTPAFACNV